MRKIPSDHFRGSIPVFLCDLIDAFHRIAFRLGAQHRVLHITKAGHLLDTKISVRGTALVHLIPEEVVQRAVEHLAKFQRLVHLGVHGIALPLGDCLPAHIQFLGKRFLRHAAAQLAKILKICSEAHTFILLYSCLFASRRKHRVSRSSRPFHQPRGAFSAENATSGCACKHVSSENAEG